jgi:hypothetical protein
MIVTSFAKFSRVSLNLMILTLYVKPTLLMKLLLPHSVDLPRSNPPPPHYKSVEVSPRNSTEAMRPYSYMSTSIKFVRHSNTTQFATNVMSVIGSFRLSSHHSLPTTSGVATNLLLPTLSSPKLLLFAPMAK